MHSKSPAPTQSADHQTESTEQNDASAELEALQAQLHSMQQEHARLQRDHAIDTKLQSADVIDIQTVRLLIDHALDQRASDASKSDSASITCSNPDQDIAEIIASLKMTKPFLFASTQRQRSASSPRIADPRPTHIEHAAAEAFATGKRSDLFRYLRLRRAAVVQRE